MKILFFILFLLYTMSLWGQHQAPAPLFRDPITDGAADPVLIWNRTEKNWWMLYTQRRANSETADVAYCYGNQIGIASSDDHGQSWVYRGTLDLDIEPGHNTFWAPDVVYHNGKSICSYLIFKAYAIIGAGMPVSPTTLVKIYGTEICRKTTDQLQYHRSYLIPDSRRYLENVVQRPEPRLCDNDGRK